MHDAPVRAPPLRSTRDRARAPRARARTAGAAVGRGDRRRSCPAATRRALGRRRTSSGSGGASVPPRAGRRPRRRSGVGASDRAAWSTSMPTNSLPTASTSPGSPCEDGRPPRRPGDEISTVALSVSTSASDRVGCDLVADLDEPLDQLGLGDALTDVGQLHLEHAHCRTAADSASPGSDAVGAGEVRPLVGVRIRRVPAAHPRDRRLEMIEAPLLHGGAQLGAEARRERRLVDDDAAAGLHHRRDDRVDVERHQRAQVDDLGIDALLRRPPPRRRARACRR